MIKLYDNGVYLLNGTEIVEDAGNVQTPLTKEEAAKNTMAYGSGLENLIPYVLTSCNSFVQLVEPSARMTTCLV